jgi:hypothetical protein
MMMSLQVLETFLNTQNGEHCAHWVCLSGGFGYFLGDYLTKHLPVHHPLEVHYELVVDEPQKKCVSLSTYHLSSLDWSRFCPMLCEHPIRRR